MMKRWRNRELIRAWICCSAAVCGIGLAGLQAQENPSASQRRQEVEHHLCRYIVLKGHGGGTMSLAEQMTALHVPAVSVAAIRDGRIDWGHAYGVVSLGGPPATSKTLFGAASIAKPVTAVGVLKLVQEGKIDLDADVNRYLKRWKIPENAFTAAKKVTARELLNHTSGIGTHNGDIYDPSQPLPTLLDMLNGVKPARTAPVRVEAVPGTKFAYSNGGYLVLYLLIEDVTGEPFAQYMQHTVFDPMGMKDSTFEAPLPEKWARRAATSYADGTTGTAPGKFVEPNLAAGGLWTTPTDLAKFLIEIRREYEGTSHKVLDRPMVRAMLTPDDHMVQARRWGLGIEVGGHSVDPYIRHEGSAYFQDDMVAYLHGSGIVVMTSGGGGGTLAEEILRSAASVYGFPDFRPQERTAVELAAATLPKYVGTYGYVKVALGQGFLTAEIPAGSSPQRLYAESPTHFFVLDGPQELSFHMDGQGQVTGVDFITPMGRHPLQRSSEK
jgi:CubicO group peptidase (beta-lactamase class C family)